MEVDETLDSGLSPELSVNNEIRNYLRETAKWGTFLAIVGFIWVGLMVLGSLAMTFFMGNMPGASDIPFPPALFGLFYLILAGVMVMPVLYLYRFSNKIKAALHSDDEVFLTEAFQNLKSLFKFYGIFTAIVIGLYALLIMGGIFAGTMF